MMRSLWIGLLLVVVGIMPAAARGAETIPPKPERYFNDYANVAPGAAAELNATLEKFEADTSNQVWVVIYPKMESDSDVASYTVHVANAWHAGMKGKNNGTILFVFVADRQAYIQVGYGLEGALPDATCKRIIDEAIEPNFKTGNYEAGLRAGVAAIMAATTGEFKGTGHTAHDEVAGLVPIVVTIIAVIAGFGLLLLGIHNFGGTFYQQHVRTLTFAENCYMFFLNIVLNLVFSGGSSSSSSSGSSSSGGGSFGGGGAGGRW